MISLPRSCLEDCAITVGIDAAQPADHPQRHRGYMRSIEWIREGLTNTGYTGIVWELGMRNWKTKGFFSEYFENDRRYLGRSPRPFERVRKYLKEMAGRLPRERHGVF